MRKPSIVALALLASSCLLDPTEMPIGVAVFWAFTVPCSTSKNCTDTVARAVGVANPPDPVADGYYPPAPDMAGSDAAPHVSVTVEVTAP